MANLVVFCAIQTDLKCSKLNDFIDFLYFYEK